ncbi:MAG: phytanoyl-CoA dioxygenase [Proteobacteria bacterium]|nr:phytanoyl-CoA dioxygenase [Pseudomonadota bacterium]
MALNLTGRPLIDQADIDQLVQQGTFGPWVEEAVSLQRNGYCLLRPRSDEHLARVDAVVADLEPALAAQLNDWEAGVCGSPRLQDGWRQHNSIRELALDEMVLDLLHHLYGRPAFAFQTLSFAVGSEQHYHSDAVHFNSYPLGFMCGVWFALQDIELNSGPLHYFSGSHRLPYLSADALGLSPDQINNEDHPQVLFEPHWQEAVAEHGFSSQRFLAEKGDIFVWHANLLHGGERVNDRRLRRWSQVVHYFFADCLYSTPMRNFGMGQGGACLRNPLDVATGQPRYSPGDWQALGLVSPDS